MIIRIVFLVLIFTTSCVNEGIVDQTRDVKKDLMLSTENLTITKYKCPLDSVKNNFLLKMN